MNPNLISPPTILRREMRLLRDRLRKLPPFAGPHANAWDEVLAHHSEGEYEYFEDNMHLFARMARDNLLRHAKAQTTGRAAIQKLWLLTDDGIRFTTKLKQHGCRRGAPPMLPLETMIGAVALFVALALAFNDDHDYEAEIMRGLRY